MPAERNTDGSLPRPRVGLGALIERDRKVLLGLRKGSHGAGEWCLPGGHHEQGFTIFQSIVNEVDEETGLAVIPVAIVSVADEMRYLESDGKQYTDLSILCDSPEGDPVVKEPHKCERWDWFSYDNLPSPLMESTEITIRNYQEGVLYKERHGSVETLAAMRMFTYETESVTYESGCVEIVTIVARTREDADRAMLADPECIAHGLDDLQRIYKVEEKSLRPGTVLFRGKVLERLDAHRYTK